MDLLSPLPSLSSPRPALVPAPTTDLDQFPFVDLPSELQASIIFFLPPSNIVALERVSAFYHKLIGSPISNELWRRTFVDHLSLGDPSATRLARLFFSYLASTLCESWKALFFTACQLLDSVDRSVAEGVEQKDRLNASPALLGYYRVDAIVGAYKLDTTLTSHFKFPRENYMRFATLFLVFESLSFRLEATSNEQEGPRLVFVGLVEDSMEHTTLAQAAFSRVLSTAMVLVSSNIFPENKALRVKLGRGLSEIVDQARSLNLHVSDETEMTILAHTGAFLEDDNAKERDRKKELQEKALAILGNSGPSDRIRHYNTACVYSTFRDFENARLWLQWTFDYHGGLYKDQWVAAYYPSTNELLDGLKFDEDFAAIRELPWYEEMLSLAEEALKAEEQAEREEAARERELADLNNEGEDAAEEEGGPDEDLPAGDDSL